MSLSNPDLRALLACAECRGALVEHGDGLRCAECAAEYEVRQGIPLLHARETDAAHLQQEEHLATVMKAVAADPRQEFHCSQWDLSKQEFWAMVAAHVGVPPKTFVNIGCGYDRGFVPFERQGNTFVNLDLVYGMLLDLQQDAGARSCVVGNVKSLPLKPGAFDYVISIDVIHHESDDLRPVLASFRDLLKPGGTLFLEDPNAWGLFQMGKSILLPRPVYRLLRRVWHRLKRPDHAPADYEFPTSVRRVAAILTDLGFDDAKVYPHSAYPCVGEKAHRVYRALGRVEYVRKYHNYHYMLSATKSE